MTWSPQQEDAIKAVNAWMRDKTSQIFRLFGYAGTGKTYLAKELGANVKGGMVLFGAFTGKAALVMKRKGCDNASTIHSMIYSIDETNREWQPKFVLNSDSDVKRAKLVIIDECSMVDDVLAKDLLSFGTKILVLGDPAQLPPVKGAGYFTEAKPDVMLTEVHRQARDNPIIAMSMLIREGGKLEMGTYGESRVIARSEIDAGQILKAGQIIVGLNKTRQSYNRRIRTLLGRQADLRHL
jgi:exodeoxyribonuclease-5